ncbi:hypothetical protein [Xenophilus sp.]|uniref:hypothetical protein n=1 Tax=Xenophilus sp. TaxID=1873499 RepID=UPI0037DD73E2
MKNVLILSVAILVSACASVYKQDGITSSEKSKIAVIIVDPCKDKQCLTIQEVDGKWRGLGSFSRYELLPGTRRLQFIFSAPGVHGTRAIIVEFEAHAGSTYELKSNADLSAMKWRPEVVDAGTGAVVSRPIGTAFPY